MLHQPPTARLAAFIPLPKSAWAEDLRFPREVRIKRQRELTQEFEDMTFPRLKNFGLDLARLHGLLGVPSYKQPFSHYPGLTWYNVWRLKNRCPKRFQNRAEFLGTLRKIFSDWFDVDAVASHYGYGFDFFVTRDTRGIFSLEHRESLREKYSVVILEPQELLKKYKKFHKEIIRRHA